MPRASSLGHISVEGRGSIPVKGLVTEERRREMPQGVRQFSEDRKEPSAGRSRGATEKLGDSARAENRQQRGIRGFLNSLLAGFGAKSRGSIHLVSCNISALNKHFQAVEG